MLQWNDLHPYNAIHTVRVPEPFDLERVKKAVALTLEGKGLTGLSLDRQAGRFEYRGGAASVEVKVARPGAVWPQGLAGELEHELNRPFPLVDSFTPFRCIVFPEANSFSLALVYFHPIADAESVVFLLKDMVNAYRARSEEWTAGPVERYPAPRSALLRFRPSVLVRKVASLPSSIRESRRTCRPIYHDPEDFTNKVVAFSVGAPALEGMIQAARSLGVTLNDFFLALLMRAVSLVAPDRPQSERRRKLAVGCIVNTRRDLGLEGQRDFGLFLGSFMLHHEAPKDAALERLARDIGAQTRAIKQRRLYLGTDLELRLGRLMMSFFSERRRRKLYQKHYPLWGGLTNMNLNALWPQQNESRPVDYLRAVSTGPVTPLVVSITTVGRVANVSLTYRSTVFAPPEIDRVKACFLEPPGSLAHL